MKPKTLISEKQREYHLDALRGFGALAVMMGHYLLYFRTDVMDPDPGQSSWFISSPLGVFVNAKFAVFVFFALSGFVLANSAVNTRLGIPAQICKRYVRLVIPMTFACLLAWALLTLGCCTDVARAEFGYVTEIAFPQAFDFSFAGALWDAVAGTFINGVTHYNGALWTMQIEIVGSVAVYLVFGLVDSWRWRALLNLAGAAALSQLGKHDALQGLQMFCWGMLIFDLTRLARSVLEDRKAMANVIGTVLLLVGIGLGSWRVKDPSLPNLGIAFKFLMSPIMNISRYEAQQVGAVLTLLAFVATPWITTTFCGRVSRFLGAISFPLYITHSTLLIAVTMPVLSSFKRMMDYEVASYIVFGLNFALCVGVAYLLVPLTEIWAVRTSHSVGKVIDQKLLSVAPVLAGGRS